MDLVLQVDFGRIQTGVNYQFFDADAKLIDSRSTAGVANVDGTTGIEVVTATIPALAVGVVWRCDDPDLIRTEALTERIAIMSILESTARIPANPASVEDVAAVVVHGPSSDDIAQAIRESTPTQRINSGRPFSTAEP